MTQLEPVSRAAADDFAQRHTRTVVALHTLQNERIRELLAELVTDRGGDRSARYAELRRWLAVREATRDSITDATERSRG
ncbi:hypothetical protein [Nocardia arizonensis]|uniref:hypothetical protein n=1 Tax=Nocardia arizonensis TaxID=1141647 RepID=UPI0012E22BA1|nr:hypothetical protein [Nocardia arizonensis]